MTLTTPTLQVHEPIAGRGEAYDGERAFAVVDYRMKEIQEPYKPSAVPTPAGVGAPGERSVYSVTRSLQAAQTGILRDYMGARLTMRLDDGRRLDFTVAKVVGKVVGIDMFLLQGLGGFQGVAA